MPRHFNIFPKLSQIDAYQALGYLIASPRFDARREQFKRFCKGNATPLVIIWPLAHRRRSVSMELFDCTTSILDEQLQTDVRNLAAVWGAAAQQAERFPVLIEGVTPRHARVLAGYLHQIAAAAYKRRSSRIRNVLVIEGPTSDGKPITSYGPFGGTCIFPTKGSRDFNCTIELDNGERYHIGYKGTQEPDLTFIRQQFGDCPGGFRLFGSPEETDS